MSARTLVPLAASLCAVALVAVVYVSDSDLVLLNEHLNHPFTFSVLAGILMIWAAFGLRRMWLRIVIAGLAGLATCAVLFVGLVISALSATSDAGFVDGPSPYRIRLQESMDGLGPDRLTQLSVRRDAGLLSREWDLGCFNSDDTDDAFESVRWTGPSSVEIRVTDGRTFPIALDPASGRPQTTPDLNC